jgi:hypothetical protein
MKPSVSLASVTIGLSLAAVATTAQAQTTVTRQITQEPVETVITQNPNGTAITRRILTPGPGGFSTLPPPNYVAPPLAGDALYPDYVEPLDTVTTRRVVASPPPPLVPPATVGVAPRAHTDRVVTHAARTVTRSVPRAAVLPPPLPPDAPLVLSFPERQVIYGAITGRQAYYPAPVAPPVVAETDYPLNRVYPADPYAYRDYAYRAPDYYHDHYVYHWDGVPLVIGGRMPPSVTLYAVPDWVLARVPAAQGYGYARLDNRVYLVDPATAVIVAEIVQ